MEGVNKEWGGGRVAWIGLILPYLMLLRASELLLEDDGRVRIVFFLTGQDVVFYASERLVEGRARHG